MVNLLSATINGIGSYGNAYASLSDIDKNEFKRIISRIIKNGKFNPLGCLKEALIVDV